MRRNQSLLLGLGCLLSLAGACDDGGVDPLPPVAGTGSSGTGAPAGSGSTAGTGTAGAPLAGTGAAGTGTSGTGAAGTGAAGTGAAGAGAGTGGGTAGTGEGFASGFAMCGKPPKEGVCKSKAPGIYAMRTEVDVYWRDENNSPTLYDPGRGKIEIFFKGELSEICEDGTGGKGVINACGTTVPPLLADATCGVIQIVFPNEMWDQPTIPHFTTVGSTTGFGVDDTLTIAKAAGLVGIDLPDVNQPWPTFNETVTFTCADGKKGADCFPDHDMDGNPGITVKLQQDGTPSGQPYQCISPWHYIPAPTSVLGALDPNAGATDTYIGLRTRIGGSGKIGADCMSGAGAAEADGFDSRLFDCKLKNGMPCLAADSQFVDKNLPNYKVLQVGETPPAAWVHPRAEADALLDRTPSKGPRSSVVRIGDLDQSVSCEQIRATTFLPYQ